MKRKAQSRKTAIIPARTAGYDAVLTDVVRLLETARRSSARTVNAIMTATYWLIGWRIVQGEQGGQTRAEYGEMLMKRLAQDLTSRFGRGFGLSNLKQMRKFFLAFRPQEKSQTLSGLSALAVMAERFPLPWSAYVRLLSVQNPQAR